MKELWRDLSATEDNEFRLWTRQNYKPYTPINELWHPVVRDEAHKMDIEETKERLYRYNDK
jgi:hypothetical protein